MIKESKKYSKPKKRKEKIESNQSTTHVGWGPIEQKRLVKSNNAKYFLFGSKSFVFIYLFVHDAEQKP